MAVRLSGALRELRFHLCQKGEASKGVREFLESNYVKLKQQHPQFPILVRECSGVKPRLWARYEKGVEHSVSLSNLSCTDVATQLEKLAKKNV